MTLSLRVKHRGAVLAACLGLVAAGCGLLPEVPSGGAQTDLTPPPLTRAIAAADGPAVLTYSVVEERPHDRDAYTEGLAVIDGRIIESTGLYGESSVREIDPSTGATVRQHALAPEQFASDVAIVNGRIVALTWRNNLALTIDVASFRPLEQRNYPTEGRGICETDGGNIVMSDGTSILIFRDATTLRVLQRLQVTDRGEPVAGLHQLECAGGSIWANLAGTAYLARVDPTSGRVTGVVDLTGLGPARLRSDDARSGFAQLGPNTWLLTGRRWPSYYVVQFAETETTLSESLNTITSNVTK